MKAPEFTTIYGFLYKTVQNTHKGCLVDQASVMDGAVRLYIYERDKFEKRLEEKKRKLNIDNDIFSTAAGDPDHDMI